MADSKFAPRGSTQSCLNTSPLVKFRAFMVRTTLLEEMKKGRERMQQVEIKKKGQTNNELELRKGRRRRKKEKGRRERGRRSTRSRGGET